MDTSPKHDVVWYTYETPDMHLEAHTFVHVFSTTDISLLEFRDGHNKATNHSPLKQTLLQECISISESLFIGIYCPFTFQKIRWVESNALMHRHLHEFITELHRTTNHLGAPEPSLSCLEVGKWQRYAAVQKENTIIAHFEMSGSFQSSDAP